jgi:glycosyltransferase involved in cell wall biosynthesis
VETVVYTTDANGDARLDVATSCPQVRGGPTVTYFRRDLPGRYFFSRALGDAVWQTVADFDLVYVPAVWTYPMAPVSSACRARNVPYVVSPRNSFQTWAFAQKGWKKRLYLRLFERRRIDAASGIHFTHETEMEEARRFRFRPRPFVVPNPIDLDTFESLPARRDARSRLGLSEDAFVLLYAGRLHAKKGLESVLEAFAASIGRHSGSVLVLLGPDEGMAPRLRASAERLGVSHQVRMPGLATDARLLDFYVAADIFVLASRSENFGMAAAEAMAAGRPVILSRFVPLSVGVAEGGAGWVVDLDIDSLATAMNEAHAGRAALPEMGEAAGQIVRCTYGMEAVATAMADRLIQLKSSTS